MNNNDLQPDTSFDMENIVMEEEMNNMEDMFIKAEINERKDIINTVQQDMIKTAVYGEGNKITYPTLGLCGEAGEVAEKVKKVLRDKGGIFSEETKQEIGKELGDVIWYVSALANDLGLTLYDVIELVLAKLRSRNERNLIHGEGDNR
jgi:NTP pyrophosphatase (non-canonical NTP hydrolase)